MNMAGAVCVMLLFMLKFPCFDAENFTEIYFADVKIDTICKVFVRIDVLFYYYI